MMKFPNRTRVRLDDVTLAVSVSGRRDDAPWIILSNSLGASLEMWDGQMGVLESNYRVLRYDTRGHGASEASPPPYTFDDLTGDVVSLMDHFGIPMADFMGLSLGGMTGLGLAIHHSPRVRRLICCDARADAPAPFAASWDERIAAIEKGGMQNILQGTMERWFTPEFSDSHPAERQRIDAMFLATNTDGYKGCAAALKNLDYLKDLGKITCPVLYVAGDQDSGAPPVVMRDMAAATPDSVFKVIERAAHIANIDNPTGFNSVISDFLNLS